MEEMRIKARTREMHVLSHFLAPSAPVALVATALPVAALCVMRKSVANRLGTLSASHGLMLSAPVALVATALPVAALCVMRKSVANRLGTLSASHGLMFSA